MLQRTRLSVSFAFLVMMMAPSYAAEQQYSCRGQLVQQMPDPAAQAKPIDLNVTLGDKNKMSLTIGSDKALAPRITSNNKIQLKFTTKEFVGEYFHYTGDLFLIYKAGPLARLTCSRA